MNRLQQSIWIRDNEFGILGGNMVGKNTQNRAAGFTIVELLIVIVVIGILAAITIVAFNGIQERAKNTQRISAAKDWQKIITLYTADKGAYPASIISNHVCLGSGYPTDLETPPVTTNQDCNLSSNVKHPHTSVSAAFATMGSAPSFPPDKMVLGGTAGTAVGLSLRAFDKLDPLTSNEKTLYPMMHYWLYGQNKDCGIKPVLNRVTGGFSSTDNVTFTNNDGAFTHCVIQLPDPENL